MADLFARHPQTVKDMIVAETFCPLHQEPVKVGFEMNGVQGKVTVRDHCSILQMGEKCSEACRSNPEILQAVHDGSDRVIISHPKALCDKSFLVLDRMASNFGGNFSVV